MKKTIAVIMALAMGLTFASCQNEKESGGTSESASSEEASSSESLPESEAQKETGSDTRILVVSFGTSYNETRKATIEAIEEEIAKVRPDCKVERAFTSQTIINKLKERDGLVIDNVKEAMDRFVSEEVKNVIVQPTHVMAGKEYDELCEAVKPYEDKFESFKMGAPLLTEDKDYENVVDIVAEETKEYAKENTAVVFMGHGTEHPANATYAKLQDTFNAKGLNNYIIGTVEAKPDLEDVKAKLKEMKAEKVVLLPFMIVAGDHATNDMAGDEEDSWKTQLKSEGYEVECVLKGLGEYEGIRTLISEKVK